MKIHNCEQNTIEWFQARMGIATASRMSDVMARGQGKTRATYMHKLIAESITGVPTMSFSNQYTERGHELEPAAVELYQTNTGNNVQEVGFITNHEQIGTVGASPDRFVGDKGMLEVKTREPHLQVELLLSDKVPTTHAKQLQAQLWVAERDWVDFICYCPSMPLFNKRVFRDEALIAEMRDAVTAFYDEMKSKIEKLENLLTTSQPCIIERSA